MTKSLEPTAKKSSHLDGVTDGESKREKYLIFSLLNECFGVPLSSIKEVIV